jgi:HK97 family phage prohead protease/HK97 family phage major capsid protein
MLLTFSSSVESADTERRVIAGKIVPYEVVGNTSAGPVVFAKDSIDIGDPGKIKMLMQHKADMPIGRMQKFQKAEDGIYASFKISSSMSGQNALVLAQEQLIDGLSVGVEVSGSKQTKDYLYVTKATLKEVSLVETPAFAEANVTKVAASESETDSTPTTTESEAILDTTPEPTVTPAEVAPVEAARPTISAAIYSEPRTPINSQAKYLQYSVKAQLGDHEAGLWVRGEDAKALKIKAADDSFSTNPAFSPVSYATTVVDTLIGSRPTIEACGGAKVIPNSGMTISHPKITTSGTVASTAEGGAPSETGIVSAYVNATVTKYAGLQRYSVELLERSSDNPAFFQAMLDNMTRAYNKATDAAVIAEIVSGGTVSTSQATTYLGIQAFIAQAGPAAYLATGELASGYIAGTSQWSLLIGAKDTTDRPIFTATNPYNAAGSSSPTSIRGNILGLDLYVDANMVSTTIDDSAFIVVPSAIAIYESPVLRLSTNVPTSGEIELMLYGYLATKTLVSGGLQKYNMTA